MKSRLRPRPGRMVVVAEVVRTLTAWGSGGVEVAVTSPIISEEIWRQEVEI